LPFSAPYSFSHPSPREATVPAASVPEKFAPGRETASVLKITKRPKLRPKDVLHRRSLEGNAASSDVPAPDAAVVHDFPIHVALHCPVRLPRLSFLGSLAISDSRRMRLQLRSYYACRSYSTTSSRFPGQPR
jgi:hypothetical protein